VEEKKAQMSSVEIKEIASGGVGGNTSILVPLECSNSKVRLTMADSLY
jgi:hypothetical protein